MIGGIDVALFEGDIKWFSVPRLDTLATVAGSVKIGTQKVFSKTTVYFDTKVPGIMISLKMLQEL